MAFSLADARTTFADRAWRPGEWRRVKTTVELDAKNGKVRPAIAVALEPA
jgi:hypothetical protein